MREAVEAAKRIIETHETFGTSCNGVGSVEWLAYIEARSNTPSVARALVAADERIKELEAANTWQPIETAPKDGRMLQLLLAPDDDDVERAHPLEDTAGYSPTIGLNNFENDEQDEWKFAGWCWSHDHFTQGEGRPVFWRPIDWAIPSLPDGAT